VQEFASQFIRDVSYHGLGSVEMKVDSRSGTLKFIEPTVGRTDYQSFLAVANGFNIPEIAYRDLAGLPAVAARPQRRPVKFIVGISDVRSALQQIGKGRDSWRGYLRSLRGRKVFALFQGNDPGPFLYRIHYATVGRLARMAKRAVRRIARALTPHSGP
jgi:predicted ATP-grasp superfamily ATP-dependent carboligase